MSSFGLQISVMRLSSGLTSLGKLILISMWAPPCSVFFISGSVFGYGSLVRLLL